MFIYSKEKARGLRFLDSRVSGASVLTAVDLIPLRGSLERNDPKDLLSLSLSPRSIIVKRARLIYFASFSLARDREAGEREYTKKAINSAAKCTRGRACFSEVHSPRE